MTAPPVLRRVPVRLTWPALCVIAMSWTCRDIWADSGVAREQLPTVTYVGYHSMILSSPYLKYRLERLLIRVFVSFLHRVSTC